MLYRKTKYSNNVSHKDVNNFKLGPDGVTYGAWPYIDNSHQPPFDESRSPGVVWGPDWSFTNPYIAVPPGRPSTTNNPMGPPVAVHTNKADVNLNTSPTGPTNVEFKMANTDWDSMTDSQRSKFILNKIENNQNLTNNLFFIVLILLFLIVVKMY